MSGDFGFTFYRRNFLQTTFCCMIKMELCSFEKSSVTYAGKECVSDWWEQTKEEKGRQQLVKTISWFWWTWWTFTDTLWTLRHDKSNMDTGDRGFVPRLHNGSISASDVFTLQDSVTTEPRRAIRKQTVSQAPVVSLTRMHTRWGLLPPVLCAPVQFLTESRRAHASKQIQNGSTHVITIPPRSPSNRFN